jgi:hypothetical protein
MLLLSNNRIAKIARNLEGEQAAHTSAVVEMWQQNAGSISVCSCNYRVCPGAITQSHADWLSAARIGLHSLLHANVPALLHGTTAAELLTDLQSSDWCMQPGILCSINVCGNLLAGVVVLQHPSGTWSLLC